MNKKLGFFLFLPVLLILAVAVIIGFSNFDDPQSAKENPELTMQYLIWSHQKITSYRYDLGIYCLCANIDVNAMPLTIVVNNGETVSVIDSKGKRLSAEMQKVVENLDTINEIFDNISWVYTVEAERRVVIYDPTYGFLTQAFIDRDGNVIDDEYQIEITNFEIVK